MGHVTQKVLTANLRAMEADGLLTRKVYAEVPPRGGIYPDGYRPQPEARAGRHGRLGHGLQSEAGSHLNHKNPPAVFAAAGDFLWGRSARHHMLLQVGRETAV